MKFSLLSNAKIHTLALVCTIWEVSKAVYIWCTKGSLEANKYIDQQKTKLREETSLLNYKIKLKEKGIKEGYHETSNRIH